LSALRSVIEQEIRERGPVPFSRYMELCLYHPQLGYYSQNAAQFGKAGDFYTSSDVHAVFGRLLSRQFDEMWRLLGSPPSLTLRELGPGRGLFAQDVLDWSEKKFPQFFRALEYELVEQSPALRERIAQTLMRHAAAGKAIIAGAASPPYVAQSPQHRGEPETWRDRLPVIVFANEFFDAIPVEIVSQQGSLRIDSRDGRLVETWVSSSPEELEFLDRYSIHPQEGERLEVGLGIEPQIVRATECGRGIVVVIDYGYTREEQLAGRHIGTLKAIRQHSVSADAYQAPGQQDITADVNFTALARIFEKLGFEVQKLVTQSQFLMGIGEANQFADAFEDCRLPEERAKVGLQLKHLVTPQGMGESFHVLVASKGIAVEQVSAVAGLSFGRR
jgi:SAM-dependent MidA family methyltransferase